MPTGGERPSGRADPARGAAPVSRRRRRPRAFHFSAGEALARSFSCFGRHFPALCLFAFILFAPLAIYLLSCAHEVWSTGGVYRGDYGIRIRQAFWPAVQRESGIVGTLLDLGLPIFVQATVTLGVFQFLRGQRVQYPRSFGRGFARLLPVAGVAILIALLIAAVWFVTGLLLAGVLSATRAGTGTFILMGLVMLLELALILSIFFVAVQTAVVEEVGSARAMSRSAWLTRGARWKIFGIILLIGVLGFIVQYVTHRVIGQFPKTWGEARLGVLIVVAVAAVLTAFKAVCAAVIYHDLRRAKEGVGIEELMRVFD